MNRQLFVNLPVKDLEKTKAFFAALGFEFDPKFTDEKAACMIIGEGSYVMLLVEKFFAGFTPKPVADATKSTEVLLCISAESRDAVHALVAKAGAAGGIPSAKPADHGFMIQSGFQDLDGHVWEIMWMDPNFVPPNEG